MLTGGGGGEGEGEGLALTVGELGLTGRQLAVVTDEVICMDTH